MDISLSPAWNRRGDPTTAVPSHATCSPGVAWLREVAARAALVQQQLEDGQSRDDVLTLHAHHATRAPQHVLARVADDLGLQRCRRAAAVGDGLADDVVLFRAAVWLLSTLTSVPDGKLS